MIAAFARLRGFKATVPVDVDAMGSAEANESTLKLWKLRTGAQRAFMKRRTSKLGKWRMGKDNS
jgi:hypothetical protein